MWHFAYIQVTLSLT